MHLDEIQSSNYKPCRGGETPPLIVFRPTENRYNTGILLPITNSHYQRQLDN